MSAPAPAVVAWMPMPPAVIVSLLVTLTWLLLVALAITAVTPLPPELITPPLVATFTPTSLTLPAPTPLS